MKIKQDPITENTNWNSVSNPPSSMREVLVRTDKQQVMLGHYNWSRKEWFEHGNYDVVNVVGWQEKEAKQKAYRFITTDELFPEANAGALYYGKAEADRYIAELKAEITRKEGVEKRWFDRCMEARAENVKLKRALWLMTAEWAEAMGLASCNIANKFMSRENFEVGDEYRSNTVKKHRHRQVVFYKYADYCRQKSGV